MPTQSEVDAGAKWLTAKLDETVPYMMRSRITGEMVFNIVLGILDEAERVRKKPQKNASAA